MTLLLLGLAVGAVLGLTGAGGSAIAVPLLMWALGWSLPQAVPVALLAVMLSAAFGSWQAWRQGLVRYRAATLMAAAALLTTPLAVWLAPRLPEQPLTLAFALVLALIGLRTLWQATRHPRDLRDTGAGIGGADAGAPVCQLNPATGRLSWTQGCLRMMAAVGALTGILSGLFGVGGGFVIVPAIRAVSNLSMQAAVATSMMAVALISALAFVLNLLHGQAPALMLAAPFALGSLAGMFASRQLAPRLPAARLQQVFGLLLLAMAVLTVLQSLG